MFSWITGRKAKIAPVVTVRKFTKSEAPKKVSEAQIHKLKISPQDVSLPHHNGQRKRLRKSPAVR